MRTLLITFDYPPMVGGIASVFGVLWRHLGTPDSMILAPRIAGADAFDGNHPANTIRFPVVSGSGVVAKSINMLFCSIWFVGCAFRYRPDVVLAGQIRRAGLIAYLWSMVTRRPFYLWVYGGEARSEFTASSRITRASHRLLRAADRVFTNSPYTTRTMVDFGLPAERVVEVPLGVNEQLSPQPKDPAYIARLGLHDKLVLLTLGRLIERKGVDTMLEALAGIDGQLPPWHYLVVSDGPYRATLEGLTTKLGLQGKVTFAGHVDERELGIYYNLCDVFAMPNREVAGKDGESLSVEGFGMVFVDAAACAKPVIAGRSGGAVYAVEDGVNGYLVEPGDVRDLQQAILRLTDAERRDTMGAAAVKFAARFRWDRSAEVLRPFLESTRL